LADLGPIDRRRGGIIRAVVGLSKPIELLRRLEESSPLEYKYNAYASWGLQNRTTQGSFEDFARDRFIIGDKGSVKEEIARYRELLAVDHFIMRCQWPGLPQEQVLSSIQRLGEIFAS
jgi:alkanesulfonate monooxygenase SsuD/methylene tetrahydromethanopterin reductase-like flavin-dependent oxidoreductase (luciferase family)